MAIVDLSFPTTASATRSPRRGASPTAPSTRPTPSSSRPASRSSSTWPTWTGSARRGAGSWPFPLRSRGRTARPCAPSPWRNRSRATAARWSRPADAWRAAPAAPAIRRGSVPDARADPL